jgi:hypothetical protein
MDFDRANQYLLDLKEVLDNAGVRFFLMFGTLLGAVRDEDFVEGDDDVDIGIFEEDMTVDKGEKYRTEIEKKGYGLYEGGTVDGVYNCFYIQKPGYPCKVDTYAFRKKDDNYYVLKRVNGGVWGIKYPAKYFSKLAPIKFKGTDYLTPAPAEEFLEYMWGTWWIAGNGQYGKQEFEEIPGGKWC